MSLHDISNAIQIVSSFTKERFPINPVEICNELEIKIKCDCPLEKDGYLICYGGKKIILIDSKINNRHRRDFIISHELGHFMLHRKQLYSCEHISEVASQNINSQSQEREANAFASELLLPNKEMRKYIPIGRPVTFSDINKIANVFDVSRTHAAIHAIMASNAESEVLICYENGKRKWFSSANKYTHSSMVPYRCPIELRLSSQSSNISGVWNNLYTGSVHQEVFCPVPGQYLVLLSGNRI